MPVDSGVSTMKLYRKADFVIVPLVVAVVATSWWLITRPTIRDCPTISGDDYNPQALLRCANRLIEMGEDGTYCLLRASASKEGKEPQDERVALLCRVLYKPSQGSPLHPPRFGAPDIPYRSMPATDWPDLPLAFSKDVPFLLVSGYTLFGVTQQTRLYVDYCRSNGVFRAKPYRIPCWREAIEALEALVLSDRWSRIKWVDSGQGWSYGYDQLELKHRLHVQVERMKATCKH